MQRALTRTSLGGPALDGLLRQLGLAEPPGMPPRLADGLGRWLGWREAIDLAAVLAQPAATPGPRADADAAGRDLARVQAALQRAIDAERPGTDTDHPPHRRRHAALQQRMEVAIAALRQRLRGALATQSPALARLAALDAVMDEALREREAALLARLPALLEPHFERLKAGAADTGQPAKWLAAFHHDLQRLLHAELALRLQPSRGLLAAWRPHTDTDS